MVQISYSSEIPNIAHIVPFTFFLTVFCYTEITAQGQARAWRQFSRAGCSRSSRATAGLIDGVDGASPS